MVMLEATEVDQRSGAPINSSLADYIVAVMQIARRSMERFSLTQTSN
jgi:hypothetical protein